MLVGNQRKTLCKLGQMGWAQAHLGLAALATSDPLYAVKSSDTAPRLATFYLKTSGGDLRMLVVHHPGGPLAAGDADYSGVHTCMVFSDSSQQQIEYARTLGFDRAGNEKAYFIY